MKTILKPFSLLMLLGLSVATCAAEVCTNEVCEAPKDMPDLPCFVDRKKLPATGPFFSGDLSAALGDAEAKNLPVVISLGRQLCPRCLKLYGFFERKELVLDPTKCVYLKLHVDNAEHREQFLSLFTTKDNHLPYLGIYRKDGDLGAPALSGETKLENYRFFLKDLLLPPDRDAR